MKRKTITIYTAQDRPCWIRVMHGGQGAENNFRAKTNDEEVARFIEDELNWRNSFSLAQEDLDSFAMRHSLRVHHKKEDKR